MRTIYASIFMVLSFIFGLIPCSIGFAFEFIKSSFCNGKELCNRATEYIDQTKF